MHRNRASEPSRFPRLWVILCSHLVGACFQQLTNSPLPTIDSHPPHFHSLTNCFFRNSRVFKNICVAPCFFPNPPKLPACGVRQSSGAEKGAPPPHPGCFGKRGCKRLKTNERSCKKRGKRVQERASY